MEIERSQCKHQFKHNRFVQANSWGPQPTLTRRKKLKEPLRTEIGTFTIAVKNEFRRWLQLRSKGHLNFNEFAPNALELLLIPLGTHWINMGGARGNLEIFDLIYCCHQTFRRQIWQVDKTLTMSAPVPPSDLLLYQSVLLPRVVHRKGWLLCRSIEDIDPNGCALKINCNEHKYG